MIDDTKKAEFDYIEIESFAFTFSEYELRSLSYVMSLLEDIDTSKFINSITKKYVSRDYWQGVGEAFFDRDFVKLYISDTVNFYNLCDLAFAIFDEQKQNHRTQRLAYYDSVREKIERSKSEKKDVAELPGFDMGDSQATRINSKVYADARKEK